MSQKWERREKNRKPALRQPPKEKPQHWEPVPEKESKESEEMRPDASGGTIGNEVTAEAEDSMETKEWYKRSTQEEHKGNQGKKNQRVKRQYSHQ